MSRQSSYRKKANEDKMGFGEIVLRFFFGFLIPFLAINGLILFLFIQTPTISVVDDKSKEYEENKIKFRVESVLPLTNVTALFQETEIPYSKLGNLYIIEANNNGTYQIKATSINKASSTSYVDIETIDSEPPTINTADAIITGNHLTFTVNDVESGINYDKLYATTENGTTLSPVYIDKASGTVQFDIESNKKITVHVEDELGNYSETTFTAS